MEWSGPAEALLEHARDKIVVLDEEGTFRYLNRATAEVLGFDPEELRGETAFEYIHPDDRERVLSRFERLVAGTEYDRTVEYRHRTDDGSYVWLESRIAELTDPEEGYVVSSRDVTERVRAERERDATAERLEELAAKADDVLWMFSADWSELLFLNAAYESIYGQPVEDIRADPRRFLEATHPDDRSAVQDAMTRLSAGESVDMEYRVNPRQDYSCWVWVQAEPIFEAGEVVRIVGFTRDVTDRRRRERQLRVIDTLLRHNLRNDLNTVIGHAEYVSEHPEDDPPSHAAAIERTAQALLHKAEKQRRTIELLTDPVTPCRVDLTTTIENAIATVEDDYDVDVETDLPPSLPACALGEIGTAIQELLGNAAKHADDAPWIRITAAQVDDRAVVEIEDTCPPIPDYEYRVLTGEQEMDDVTHTSGLGLWLVYWVVDLSDGTISFETDDDGNTVTVSLPLATSEP
ncbi:PAS domain-containing sensor histidine kinase [Halorientalis regularis]|jgi:PAS domain S-box-containing protein|uniref:histidine kinase n=1 Tax=Halorientalis regularis TaxID=660518 RepID=A0A1G7L5U0_9EURY|nr:PAS domain-containing sensor histidine kinase [Halorientalis regularis]SDF44848.1 PAS domain S-box-containing protein [Halorientalis regularis]